MIIINTIKLIKGDCSETLTKLKDESIDLIVTDPPYGINYQSGMRKDKFDKILGDGKTYIDLIHNALEQSQRLLKEGGHVYVFCSWHNIDLFKQEFEKYFELKNILIWKKKGGFIGDLETQYGVDYEFILFGYKKWDYLGAELNQDSFSNLKLYSKDLQEYIGLSLKEINKKLNHRRAEHFFYHSSTQYGLCTEKTYNELIEVFKIDSFDKFREYSSLKNEYEELNQYYLGLNAEYDKRKPLNGKRISGVIETSKVSNAKYIHPTQKPTEILNILIEKSSNEGDTVLDCFMGVASTGESCMQTNRNFIGMELDDTYFETCKNRVNTYIKENNMQDVHIDIAE
jgi:site-specific DNA-methyltransferase (adenine-specific)